jgi:signal transduction histidine kinase
VEHRSSIRSPSKDMQSETSLLDMSRRLQRLERRLEILGKICRHDLPNQLVAIRGLVNLLLEESSRFGTDGQEYSNRILRAAERALDMLQAVKTLLAIDAHADQPEEIDLTSLAQDLFRETRKLFPQAAVEHHFAFEIPKVRGKRRALQQAIGELLRHGLTGQARANVEMESHPGENGVEIALAIGPDRIHPDPTLLSSGGDTRALENRLELLVVRELAQSWGGDLRFREVPGGGFVYALLIPAC